MKNFIIMIPGALIMLFLIAGCATVDVGKDFNSQALTMASTTPVAHINADNYGYYLFSFIPIWTGRPEDPDGCSFFTDQVTVDKVTDMLTKKSKELGATKTVNLQSHMTWTGRFSLWILWLKEIQVSGDAVK